MIEFMDRDGIMQVINAVRRISGRHVETPKCVSCLFFDRGMCKQWNERIPVESWRVGCDKYEWIPF
jgi:hypothetical protein